MNRQDLIAEIRYVWDVISQMKIDLSFSNPIPLVASEKFKEVSRDRSSSYERIYLVGLKNSEYNILLADHSYFQFGFAGQNSLRFAYYPNPFFSLSEANSEMLKELEYYLEEGIVSYEDYLMKLSELRNGNHAPYLRFDYSAAEYKKLSHPAAHLHLGNHFENRWPTRKILTPKAFALIILKHFYSNYWEDIKTVSILGVPHELNALLARCKMDCSIVPIEFFDADEENQFHLA
ncbi:DUF2290 domain-containing protein [Pseudaquidulcibacter saccharophilus]|uniref:DUF2290 domain-containing protein n=1 Tax=Pseudaquidulcibacter saccharophilus TaxID=2831900 RepID=UPI001EFEFC9A|nr:DUF2290 domain-containing protein [Pseudaquidulcibacter saccharophilus]